MGYRAAVEQARRARRPLARISLDWSERRPHVAGVLGAALVDALLARCWVARVPTGRAVRVPKAGRHGLRDVLSPRVSDALAPGAAPKSSGHNPAHGPRHPAAAALAASYLPAYRAAATDPVRALRAE